MPIFWQNKQLLLLGPKFAQKWNLGLEFQKSKYGFSIRTSKTPFVPIFTQNGQFEFFGLNLGKLPNYVRYLCSDIVEGVAESCMEAEMTWVEVDGDGWRWVHGLAIIALKNILAKQNSRPHIYLNQTYLNGMNIFS